MSNSALDHFQIAELQGGEVPDWDALYDDVLSVSPGRSDAIKHEKSIEALLTALFYPSLEHPVRQTRIHEGRKIIDITYTNIAKRGFFKWVGDHYRAPKVFVECKNYSGEIGNPELDQLSGRFSPRRGEFGILVCRKITNKARCSKKCRDTSDDGRGFIITLDDVDLNEMVDEKKRTTSGVMFHLLRKKFDELIH